MKEISKYIEESPNIKTIIQWYDLPENKVIKLNPKFQKKIINNIYGKLKYGEKKKLAKKLGIGLCPAEVGPHLRLKYPGGEWMLIAMKQITDRSGDPDVFDLGSLGVRLELRSSGARPGRRWGGGSEFVFLSASET